MWHEGGNGKAYLRPLLPCAPLDLCQNTALVVMFAPPPFCALLCTHCTGGGSQIDAPLRLILMPYELAFQDFSRGFFWIPFQGVSILHAHATSGSFGHREAILRH